MADISSKTDGPSPLSAEGYDESLLPDYHTTFISDDDLAAFASALSAPDPSPSSEDLLSPSSPALSFTGTRTQWEKLRRGSSLSIPGSPTQIHRSRGSWGGGQNGTNGPSTLSREGSVGAYHRNHSQHSLFISAQNDWAPIPSKRVGGGGTLRKKGKEGGKKKHRSSKKKKSRTKDETREGLFYNLLKWPLLFIVGAWVTGLGLSYLATRMYIWLYEHLVAWRGKKLMLKKKLLAAENYEEWVEAAKELDTYLGNDKWKKEDEYAYYDSQTVRRVLNDLRRARRKVEAMEKGEVVAVAGKQPLEELKSLVEACVKNNFVGIENARLYSQSYYGTKNLVQDFTDEGKLVVNCPYIYGLANAVPHS